MSYYDPSQHPQQPGQPNWQQPQQSGQLPPQYQPPPYPQQTGQPPNWPPQQSGQLPPQYPQQPYQQTGPGIPPSQYYQQPGMPPQQPPRQPNFWSRKVGCLPTWALILIIAIFACGGISAAANSSNHSAATATNTPVTQSNTNLA